MNRIVLGFVLVVALVAALVIWLFPPSGEHAQPTSPSSIAPSAIESPPDSLELPHIEPNERASTAQTTEAAPPTEASKEPEGRAPIAAVEEFGRIFGRVVRPDGAPAAERELHFLRFPKGPKHDVVAGAEGEFDERNLPVGKWYVSTQPSKKEMEQFGAPAKANEIEYASLRVVTLEPRGEVEIVLGVPPPNAIRVTGRVRADKPREVMLVWTPEGESAYARTKWTRASSESAYEVMLETPGRYAVGITGVGAANLRRSVEVPDTREFTFDIDLGKSGIVGRVHTAEGVPVARATVELTIRGAREPEPLFSRGSSRSMTDTDGRFAFELVDPGRYVVTAHGGKAKGAPMPAAVIARDIIVGPGNGAIELDLVAQTGDVLRGRVVRESQTPVGGVRVFVFDENGEPINPLLPVTTDKEGTFSTPPVAAGQYSLIGARGAEWTAPIRVFVRWDDPPKDTELVLGEAAMIEVRGMNLGQAWIDVRDADGNCLSAVFDMTQQALEDAVTGSLERGLWRYFVPAGTYDVRAVGSAGIVATGRVSATAGESRHVTLAR